jgi:hypothetical protein
MTMTLLLRTIVPLLLPFLLYFAGRMLLARRRWPPRGYPWFSLTVLGLVLACLSLASLAIVRGPAAFHPYLAPRLDRGAPQPAGPEPSDR